jgi:2-polyprenyl-3-methyl-5-hydroxy-6-metoxy-1,4-benzoquinol methylase
MKSKTKDNRIENWDNQYKTLEVTYSERSDSLVNISQNVLYRFVYEDIAEHLPNYQTAKILECGCGGARNSLYLAFHGLDVSCSDYSSEAIRLAKANFLAQGIHGNFLKDDLFHSKIPDNSFDCVMSFGLLEHFRDLQPLVTNLTRLVKPGGIQIHIIIPKKFSTETIANLIKFPYRFLYFSIKKKEFKDIIRRSYRDFPHYENSFSEQEYSKAFEESGNNIIYCEPWNVLFPLINFRLISNIIVKYFPEKIEKIYRKLRHRTKSRMLYFFSVAYWIICRKKSF